jgi:uncharacterized protein YndB with AHSA1/START domain
MISPKEEVHWCKLDYKKIVPQKSYSGLDAFCDENGTINTAFPRMLWNNVFSEKGDLTVVDVTITYESLADLEKILELGFKEGFTMCMQNLDELLPTLK